MTTVVGCILTPSLDNLNSLTAAVEVVNFVVIRSSSQLIHASILLAGCAVRQYIVHVYLEYILFSYSPIASCISCSAATAVKRTYELSHTKCSPI